MVNSCTPLRSTPMLNKLTYNIVNKQNSILMSRMWDIHFPRMKTVGTTHWETCLPQINDQEIYICWFRHLRIKIQRILLGQESPKATSHQQHQFYKQLLNKIYTQDMNFEVHMMVAIRVAVLSDWRRVSPVQYRSVGGKCFLYFYIWVSVHHKSIAYKEPTRCNFGSIVY